MAGWPGLTSILTLPYYVGTLPVKGLFAMRITSQADKIVLFQLKDRTSDLYVKEWVGEILRRNDDTVPGGSFKLPDFPVSQDELTYKLPKDSKEDKLLRKLKGFTIETLPQEAGFSRGGPCSLCKNHMERGSDRYVLDLVSRSGEDYTYWLCGTCRDIIVLNQES